MEKAPKIYRTKDYGLFKPNDENRPLDLKKHRDLEESMKQYGFIPSYPLVCERDGRDNLKVKDGQHRLEFAKRLSLPVFWVEDDIGFDVATINNTQKTWVPMDYAKRFADAGKRDYEQLIQFKEEYGIPLTTAATLLAGNTTFFNVSERFYDGEFKIKDAAWGKSVASIYTSLVKLEKSMKGAGLLNACMAVARVPSFSAKRLLACAERNRGELVCYGKRDEYLRMLEDVYNFGQKSTIPLRLEAIKAMRQRNPKHKKHISADDAP